MSYFVIFSVSSCVPVLSSVVYCAVSYSEVYKFKNRAHSDKSMRLDEDTQVGMHKKLGYRRLSEKFSLVLFLDCGTCAQTSKDVTMITSSLLAIQPQNLVNLHNLIC